MKKKTRILIVIAEVAVLVAVVAVFLVQSGREKNVEKVEAGTSRAKSKLRPYLVQKNAAVSAVKYPSASTASGKSGRPKRNKGVVGRPGSFADANPDGLYRDSDGKPYPEADQKIMAAAAAAIDEDDLDLARSLAEQALASDNKELREMVVDALGWFGEEAMSELTPFMSDPDEDVAEQATSHWKDALQEVSDEGTKAGIVEMSLGALKNKDILEDVANELIDIDELAALQVIANVMEAGDGVAAEALREVYDSITGEEWTGVDAAEEWLQKNYTPPDDDDDDKSDDDKGSKGVVAEGARDEKDGKGEGSSMSDKDGKEDKEGDEDMDEKADEEMAEKEDKEDKDEKVDE
jgi:hypothetical protein